MTADDLDLNIDSVRNVSIKILTWFGVPEDVELKILKRGFSPLGGGQVYFTCPIVSSIRPIQFQDIGRIKRIRGIA